MAGRILLEKILSHFPQENLKFAFAYGSGVFRQGLQEAVDVTETSENMIDLVFAVDDPVRWHAENLRQNRRHYSFLRHLGAAHIARVQEKFGAGVYFNTLVPCENRTIKYGVISTGALQNDLLDWNTLYVSGRLHKPVLMLRQDEGDVRLQTALLTNKRSAVHTALLLLSDSFTEGDLYLRITGMSYAGDFRMKVGEDRNKVAKIVRPNLPAFREVYESFLLKESHLRWDKSKGEFEQSLDPASRYHHLSLLPKSLQLGLVAHRNRDGRHRDTEEVVRGFAHDREHCVVVLEECLRGIVKQSSVSQSLKGIFTAGLYKSLRYSYGKLAKMVNSYRY